MKPTRKLYKKTERELFVALYLYVNVCVCIHVYTCMYMCIYIYTHTHIYIYIYLYTYEKGYAMLCPCAKTVLWSACCFPGAEPLRLLQHNLRPIEFSWGQGLRLMEEPRPAFRRPASSKRKEIWCRELQVTTWSLTDCFPTA